jgi:hypothetical protein
MDARRSERGARAPCVLPRPGARGTSVPSMSAPLAIVACANHEGREAIGVCVRCRLRVCGECTTKIDGINHCVRCFAELAKEHAQPEKTVRREGEWGRVLFTTGSFAMAVLVAWGMLELLLPSGGP